VGSQVKYRLILLFETFGKFVVGKPKAPGQFFPADGKQFQGFDGIIAEVPVKFFSIFSVRRPTFRERNFSGFLLHQFTPVADDVVSQKERISEIIYKIRRGRRESNRTRNMRKLLPAN